jgi:hypothetical protein
MSVSEDQHARQQRAAKNQSLFREINERVRDLNDAFSAITESSEWICECADDTCVEKVAMSMNDYEAIRAAPEHFLVAAAEEHVWPDVERIVVRLDKYWVVEKFGLSGELAKQADPRSHNGDGLPR